VFLASIGKSAHTDWSRISFEQLRAADFPIYVTSQKRGDLVVFPSATAHQVINVAPIVTRAVWNILHSTSMELFLDYVQPAYRQLCHPDNGRVPLIPLCALQRYLTDNSMHHFLDVKRLLDIFQLFVDDEDIQAPLSAPINQIDTQGAIVECNFCGLVIWNRHLRCEECQDFDICLTCFVNGRSCKHTSRYTWSEILPRSLCNRIINDVKVQLHLQPAENKERTTARMPPSTEERYDSTTGYRV
jgi:hypothetical protein